MMGADSKIEWTDHTFNPWWGCQKVSEGCAHCYAETFAAGRLGLPIWGSGDGVTRKFFGDAHWREPEKWNRQAAKLGVRQRVFCASMADVFEGPETIPENARAGIDLARNRLFRLILDTPHLDWLLLTKRPVNIWPVFGAWLRTAALWNRVAARKIDPDRLPLNVWAGTTVENQKRADERIPELLKVPAAVRFLSMEPLLGPVDLVRYLPNTFTGFPRGARVNWVIVGGESGAGARPMHPAWVRSLRDQCLTAGVSFFFKQWGEWQPDGGGAKCSTTRDRVVIGIDGKPRQPGEPNLTAYPFVGLSRVGKKSAGRLLDGKEYSELPTGDATC